jgi:hypothetical protein
MVESQPDLAAQLRRVRGGYLKIQGTWMPYEVSRPLSILSHACIDPSLLQVALRLARRCVRSLCLNARQPSY